MNYRHELQNTGNTSCVSCLGWRWHGGKNCFYAVGLQIVFKCLT